jgi:hypothetical protein
MICFETMDPSVEWNNMFVTPINNHEGQLGTLM